MKKILFAIILVFLWSGTANAVQLLIKWEPGNGTWDYEEGDIIEVINDGGSFGKSIDPRITGQLDFIVVQITGLPINDFIQYKESITGMKRRFRLDKGTKIPQSIINKIERDGGYIEITQEQWNTFIADKGQ